MTIGFVSYSSALLAYLILALLLATKWRGRLMGLYSLAAVCMSVLWSGTGLAVSAGVVLPLYTLAFVDWVRNGAWFLLLLAILLTDQDRRRQRSWRQAFALVFGLAGLSTVLLPAFARDGALAGIAVGTPVLLAWVLQAIIGLLLIEQVYRNREVEARFAVKHLCLGLGAAFAYDLFFFSDALLLQRIDLHVWVARGAVNAMIVPLIAVSILRSPEKRAAAKLSRKLVFHSVALGGAGVYLLAMAAAGSYIRAVGGGWGIVLQIAFFCAAAILLLVLLFSTHLRARLRVFLGEHFFRSKYDYREEWLRFTDTLSSPGFQPWKAVITALAQIVSSPGGMLWMRNDYGVYELAGRTSAREPPLSSLREDDPLVAFMTRSWWIVNLDEYQRLPDLYEGFDAPAWIAEAPDCWLVIPLVFRAEMCGFVVLTRPGVRRPINWEDRSLLKVAGRQAASHVAQYLADQALVRARQFEAFHQLSAYVVHDLKNLIGQQSLILANAEKHKGNPAFIDDVIATIGSSVERMNRLRAQLRDGVRGQERTSVNLASLVSKAVAARADRLPRPGAEISAQEAIVHGDEEALLNVFGHLIQNAQEATPPSGKVTVRLNVENDLAIVDIEDSGAGMSEGFIRERLFRPFDSTKGLTGMGIGVFESRELIRRLGGVLTVRSAPGEGSLFRIAIPRVRRCALSTEDAKG